MAAGYHPSSFAHLSTTIPAEVPSVAKFASTDRSRAGGLSGCTGTIAAPADIKAKCRLSKPRSRMGRAASVNTKSKCALQANTIR